MFTVVHYLDATGKDHYQAWLDSLRDRRAKIAIIQRTARLHLGLFGDHKHVRDGIHELRIDIGPGYRVYYAVVGAMLILLTSGGSKRTQTPDIERAINLLNDWKKRNGPNTSHP
ncbi:type II toxin-antitoxin system RelE/ParE family toxin [Pseudoduganella namucuonensis]|uniref:type II toxin-antitoxin system RelE/ParE family toxin n=1 Tax=Pseudoduganella namucuonensis TaxID=1035707 RepID=UPI000B877D64|nr:type II toxin-antitoxin system RelE/ParE family toxin [Pseudoduganella namucuonensis]